jgi:hypothetical protein
MANFSVDLLLILAIGVLFPHFNLVSSTIVLPHGSNFIVVLLPMSVTLPAYALAIVGLAYNLL